MPVDTSIMLVGTKEAGMIMWIVICPDPECPQGAHTVHSDVVSWS